MARPTDRPATNYNPTAVRRLAQAICGQTVVPKSKESDRDDATRSS